MDEEADLVLFLEDEGDDAGADESRNASSDVDSNTSNAEPRDEGYVELRISARLQQVLARESVPADAEPSLRNALAEAEVHFSAQMGALGVRPSPGAGASATMVTRATVARTTVSSVPVTSAPGLGLGLPLDVLQPEVQPRRVSDVDEVSSSFAGLPLRWFRRPQTRRQRREFPRVELDLHGFTAAEAERCLALFLAEVRGGIGLRWRRVAVITGRGHHSAGVPVLPSLVRAWLQERALPYREAPSEYGGRGALWVDLDRGDAP